MFDSHTTYDSNELVLFNDSVKQIHKASHLLVSLRFESGSFSKGIDHSVPLMSSQLTPSLKCESFFCYVKFQDIYILGSQWFPSLFFCKHIEHLGNFFVHLCTALLDRYSISSIFHLIASSVISTHNVVCCCLCQFLFQKDNVLALSIPYFQLWQRLSKPPAILKLS